MLAAGNVKTEEEAAEIIRIALDNLHTYIDEVKEFNNNGDEAEVVEAQNYYCHNQQQNPHTPAVMKSLGLPEEDVDIFCRDMLFPKLA
jgi:SUMO ligase MMS21 Smc5/6 complex component